MEVLSVAAVGSPIGSGSSALTAAPTVDPAARTATSPTAAEPLIAAAAVRDFDAACRRRRRRPG
ncbi:MAG TPA: hypothetical protein PLS63_07435 [Microthrixaceae bacterium]|nr:hypothetical protein [Microthrixaceae bacterium]